MFNSDMATKTLKKAMNIIETSPFDREFKWFSNRGKYHTWSRYEIKIGQKKKTFFRLLCRSGTNVRN